MTFDSKDRKNWAKVKNNVMTHSHFNPIPYLPRIIIFATKTVSFFFL